MGYTSISTKYLVRLCTDNTISQHWKRVTQVTLHWSSWMSICIFRQHSHSNIASFAKDLVLCKDQSTTQRQKFAFLEAAPFQDLVNRAFDFCLSWLSIVKLQEHDIGLRQIDAYPKDSCHAEETSILFFRHSPPKKIEESHDYEAGVLALYLILYHKEIIKVYTPMKPQEFDSKIPNRVGCTAKCLHCSSSSKRENSAAKHFRLVLLRIQDTKIRIYQGIAWDRQLLVSFPQVYSLCNQAWWLALGAA